MQDLHNPPELNFIRLSKHQWQSGRFCKAKSRTFPSILERCEKTRRIVSGGKLLASHVVLRREQRLFERPADFLGFYHSEGKRTFF